MAQQTSVQAISALPDLSSFPSLISFLSILFEPSPPLRTLLVPTVLSRLTELRRPPVSYSQVIDFCEDVGEGWTWDQKAEFLSGHPLIGEVKGLSAMSGKEQGGATRKVVLDRLAHLNELYGTIFPGLRYITFVNGRTRAEIIPEMETILGLAKSPQPLPDDFDTAQPAVESDRVKRMTTSTEDDKWQTECERGLGDVWRIGRARLAGLGLQ